MTDSTDDDNGGVILDGPFDPDAQATVSDYVDYTEYLPADLIRSLTLIRGLDERYLESTQTVHELTKTYGQLPDIPSDARPSPPVLRREISRYLDRAINARESAYGEACRLYDVVDRHFDRLGCIKQKLRALPHPVPRDPSPVGERDQVAPVDNSKRTRAGRKGEGGRTTRITLRFDNSNKEGPSSAPPQKSRSRRSAIAAEHLAGMHPDSPIASTEQSDADVESKAVLEPDAAAQKPSTEKRRSRQAQSSNALSSVAGISTSNALALLEPPPDGAQPGSNDLPWLRLTEWEMTKLRKKMKKNAVWQPSEVMIHRELALRGRGWEAYRAAKAEAESAGNKFVDIDDMKNNDAQGKLARKNDDAKAASTSAAETKLSNRGMKLNEAKKLKREHQAREQAAVAAAEAEIGLDPQREVDSTLESELPAIDDHDQDVSPEIASSTRGKARPSRKRKLDEISEPVPQPDTQTTAATSNLRTSTRNRRGAAPRNEAIASTSTGSAITDTSNVSSDGKKQPSRLSSPSGSKRQAAQLATSKTRNTSTPPATSRLRSAATPAEPARATRELRRKSATPARKTPVRDASRGPAHNATDNRRRKRPAPGPVSSGQDGGAAVSYGRRKAKPAKKRVGAGTREQGAAATGGRSSQRDSATANQDLRLDEDGVLEEVDPNEPRYCICGDISFGTMICCENPDVGFLFVFLLLALFSPFSSGVLICLYSVTKSGSTWTASVSLMSPVGRLNGTVLIVDSNSTKAETALSRPGHGGVSIIVSFTSPGQIRRHDGY